EVTEYRALYPTCGLAQSVVPSEFSGTQPSRMSRPSSCRSADPSLYVPAHDQVQGQALVHTTTLLGQARSELGLGTKHGHLMTSEGYKKPLRATYPARKASIGSTDAARRAGKNAAALAASRNRPVTIRMTGASTA